MWCNDKSVSSLPSRFHGVANDSNFLLTWLQCWPLFTRNPDILEGNVAIRQQEAQWLAKGFHVEVEYFVFRHCQFFSGISRKFSFLISWINFALRTFSSHQLSLTFINFKSQILPNRSILTVTTQLKNSLRKDIKRRSGLQFQPTQKGIKSRLKWLRRVPSPNRCLPSS